jgi:hypothetical protein
MENIIQYVPCSFINTTDPPIKIGPVDNMWVQYSETHCDHPEELIACITRKYYYPHPDAPDTAMLSVQTIDKIITARPGGINYPPLYMLLQAQNMVLNILPTPPNNGD